MNILLLAADSLRADRLNPVTMPRMSAWSSRATVFDQAHVSVPRTYPSWVSLLTGRFPSQHGIVTMFPRWEDRAKDFAAMPSVFARAGYRTAVVSDFAGDIFPRIELGFSEIVAPTFDMVELLHMHVMGRETPLMPFLQTSVGRELFPALKGFSTGTDPEALVERAVEIIDGNPDDPFFMTVFAGTAHFPYSARAPYHRRFTSPEYRGRYKYQRDMDVSNEVLDDDDIRHVRALYDGAVSSVDAAFGTMLDELARRGLSERTIVVLLADHGEFLFEHNRSQGHGEHMFGDQNTHIPLVIFDPRRPEGRHETRIVRDVDLAPTLYELANVAPPPNLDGRSLVPALPGSQAELSPAFAYSETDIWFVGGDGDPTYILHGLRLPYPGIEQTTEVDEEHHHEVVLKKSMRPVVVAAKHRMIRDQRFKLVYVPTRMGAKYMLYDTVADPDEIDDVADRYPEEVARLGAELRAYILRDPTLVLRNGVAVPREPATASAAP